MDTRSRRAKLEAMASQSASPAEAEIARAKLEALPPPRTLTRADILAAPDLRVGVGTRRVYVASMRATVVIDVDDPAAAEFFASSFDWDGVE